MDLELTSLSIDTNELLNVCDEIERNELNHSFHDQSLMELCDEFDGKLVEQTGRGTKRKAEVDVNSDDIKRIKSATKIDFSRTSQQPSTSNEAGIRGGVSQCSNRFAKANNKFMEDYDSEKPNSYLTYFDANNLYGWAMSQSLPVGSFEWIDSNTDYNVSDNSDFDYVLEVDLEYPDELHNLHSDFPLCPENIVDAESLLEEKGSIQSIESEANPLYSPTQILSLIPKTYNKKGSNIVDLINDSLRPLNKSDPIGWDRFAKALKDIKLPLTYIGNPKRCEFINQLQAKDSDLLLNKTSEIEVQEFSTPSSGDKRYIAKPYLETPTSRKHTTQAVSSQTAINKTQKSAKQRYRDCETEVNIGSGMYCAVVHHNYVIAYVLQRLCGRGVACCSVSCCNAVCRGVLRCVAVCRGVLWVAIAPVCCCGQAQSQSRLVLLIRRIKNTSLVAGRSGLRLAALRHAGHVTRRIPECGEEAATDDD
ncbi:unnamed protein product [Colias eurytheme]|nr:unnamed protein product [Colias eurytheme]